MVTNIPDVSNIGYPPVIDSSVMDMATINEILKQSVAISGCLQLPEIVLVFDKAIYAKAQTIRWKEEEFTNRIVVRVGEFYTIMSYCSGTGKIFKDAGLKEIISLLRLII